MGKTDIREQWLIQVTNTIGTLMKFWGFKHNMGRVWALLYLEPTPMSAADIAEKLSLSSGAVSMTMAELVTWGVVKKSWVPGDRRDFYVAEIGIWKMVSRVFRRRELQHIRSAIEVFENAIQQLESRSGDGDRFVRDRIRTLLQLAQTGERLLTAVLSGESIDASPLKTVHGSAKKKGEPQ